MSSPHGSHRHKEPLKDKVVSKSSDFMNSLRTYASNINRETVVYILLAIGLVLLLVMPLLGQVIIGLIAGFTFADEIIATTMGLKETIERDAVLRGVVLGVVLLAFFIEAPALVIGGAIAVALKQVVMPGIEGRK